MIIWLFFLPVIYAETEIRTPTPSSNSGYDKTIPEYVNPKFYNILGIDIDQATLSQIQKKIGHTQIKTKEHTEKSICYTNSTESLEFSISSLGYGYTVKNTANSSCSLLDTSFVNDFDIKIGTNKAEIISSFGNPTMADGSMMQYTYWIQEFQPNKNMWLDIFSTIYFNIKDGVVKEYSIFTTETY